MSFILLFVLIAQLNVSGYANYTNECLCSTIDCPAILLLPLIYTFRLHECSKDAIDRTLQLMLLNVHAYITRAIGSLLHFSNV